MWEPDWLDLVSQQTYETLREQYIPELPPIDFGAHLVPVLFEVGPSVSGGMGASAIDDVRLGWWQRNTGTELRAWEVRWLIRLSREYTGESSKATKRHAPPPWRAQGEPAPMTELQAQLKESLEQ